MRPPRVVVRYSVNALALLLAERGEVHGLIGRADRGEAAAARQLAQLLVSLGDVDGLAARADRGDRGDRHAAMELARLLGRRGDVDALTVARRLSVEGFRPPALAQPRNTRISPCSAPHTHTLADSQLRPQKIL